MNRPRKRRKVEIARNHYSKGRGTEEVQRKPMPQPAHIQCVRFKNSGHLRVGEASIQRDGEPLLKLSVDKRLWECLDCGRQIWLVAGVDPNVLPKKAAP